MYNDTEFVVLGEYSLQVSHNPHGYYASLTNINDVNGNEVLYVRSDGTIARSMWISGESFGYCDTLDRVKVIVKSMFPYHYDKIDYSKLESL